MDDKEMKDFINGFDLNKDDHVLEFSPLNEKRIKEIAMQKFNRKTKKRRVSVALVACLTLVIATTAFAKGLPLIMKAWPGKTMINSIIVDGDAYALDGGAKLNDDMSITELIVNEEELTLKLTTELSKAELGEVTIATEDESYVAGGYSETKDGFFFLFYNTDADRAMDIVPFQQCQLNIADLAFDIDLSGAVADVPAEDIKVMDKEAEQSEEKVITNTALEILRDDNKVYITPNLADTNFTLSCIGLPTDIEYVDKQYNEESGVVSMSQPPQIQFPYTLSEASGAQAALQPLAGGLRNNGFALPADFDDKDTLVVPGILVQDRTQDITVNIDLLDENTAPMMVDFNHNKAEITQVDVDGTKVKVVFELNKENTGYRIFDINSFSEVTKEIITTYNGNEMVMDITLKEAMEVLPIQFTWTHYVIEDGWKVTLEDLK